MPTTAEVNNERATRVTTSGVGPARAIILQFVRPEQVTNRWLVVYALGPDGHIYELERFDCRGSELPTQGLVRTLIDKGERRFIVDLAELTSIDSSGVGQLVAAWCRARKVGGMLAVLGAGPRVREVFKIVRLDRVLPLCTTLEEAMKRVEQGALLSDGRVRDLVST